MSQKDGCLLVKLLLIGDSGVGKSGVLVRFTENKFTESYVTTIGIDFKVRELEIDGQRFTVQLWDTAGQERFRTITSAYYRGAHGIILMYDVTCRESYNNVSYWMRHIEKFASESVGRIILGNKIDLKEKRVVSSSDGQLLSKQYNVDFYEVSAKTGTGVESAIVEFAKAVKRRNNIEAVKPSTSLANLKTVPIPEGKKGKRRTC
jgi:small GTP-binding protein